MQLYIFQLRNDLAEVEIVSGAGAENVVSKSRFVPTTGIISVTVRHKTVSYQTNYPKDVFLGNFVCFGEDIVSVLQEITPGIFVIKLTV